MAKFGRLLGSRNLHRGGDSARLPQPLGHVLPSKNVLPATCLTCLAVADWDSNPCLRLKQLLAVCFSGRVEWPLSRDHQLSFESVLRLYLATDMAQNSQRRMIPVELALLSAFYTCCKRINNPFAFFFKLLLRRRLPYYFSWKAICTILQTAAASPFSKLRFAKAIHICPDTFSTCNVFLIEIEDRYHGRARGFGRPFSVCNIPDQRLPVRIDGLSFMDTRRILRAIFSGTSISASRLPVSKTHGLPSACRLRYSSPADSHI